jgi:excisionase family DNA binding protein
MAKMVLMGHTGHRSESALWTPNDRMAVDTIGEIMSTRTADAEPLLTPAEVATMFRVDPKTVTRWAKAGKLTSIRTLGGHRRYRETEVRSLLAGVPQQRS